MIGSSNLSKAILNANSTMNSSATTISVPFESNFPWLGSANWAEDLVAAPFWTSLVRWRGHLALRSSATIGADLWGEDPYTLVLTRSAYSCGRPTLQDLGWTQALALETRMRLKSFQEDWEFPGMEAYNEL
jgi:hypothetical protein